MPVSNGAGRVNDQRAAMGRKSSLTPEQWVEVERRHLVGGESINSLAKEFGVDEAAIRRKIRPSKSEKSEGKDKPKPLIALANEKVAAEKTLRNISEEIAELPIARQQIVNDLSKKLMNISSHLASAAEYGAATAHRLAGIANLKVSEIDDAKPLGEDSLVALKGIVALTRLANESSEIGLNLLRANRDSMPTDGNVIIEGGLPEDD
jgi:transposase-like protein